MPAHTIGYFYTYSSRIIAIPQNGKFPDAMPPDHHMLGHPMHTLSRLFDILVILKSNLDYKFISCVKALFEICLLICCSVSDQWNYGFC